jgi:hypothetical protein
MSEQGWKVKNGQWQAGASGYGVTGMTTTKHVCITARPLQA